MTGWDVPTIGESTPGVPFGLTWNGGAAYAERISLKEKPEYENSAQIQILLQEDVEIDQKSGSRNEIPLMIAARHGNFGIARSLLKAGANVNLRNKYGDTALTAAAWKCHPNEIELFLEHGADPNLKDKKGKTALSYANCDIGKMLPEAGAKE